MTIKAILRDGHIEPLEPLPVEWKDGQELIIEYQDSKGGEAEIAAWAQELENAASRVPIEEHARFLHALEDIDRQSNEIIRREWGKS